MDKGVDGEFLEIYVWWCGWWSGVGGRGCGEGVWLEGRLGLMVAMILGEVIGCFGMDVFYIYEEDVYGNISLLKTTCWEMYTRAVSWW